MPSVLKSLRYPISMSIVAAGGIAILLAAALDLALQESMVAGLLGLWGMIIAGIGVFAVAVIWLLGKLD